jgi:topoisomerase IV subunit A
LAAKYAERENEIIEVAEFIGVKSWKAKAKDYRITKLENIKEIEPVVKDEHDKPESDELIESGGIGRIRPIEPKTESKT